MHLLADTAVTAGTTASRPRGTVFIRDDITSCSVIAVWHNG